MSDEPKGLCAACGKPLRTGWFCSSEFPMTPFCGNGCYFRYKRLAPEQNLSLEDRVRRIEQTLERMQDYQREQNERQA